MVHDHILTSLHPDQGKPQASGAGVLTLVVFFSAISFLGLIIWISLAGDKTGGEPEVVLAFGSEAPQRPASYDAGGGIDAPLGPEDQARQDAQSVWTTLDQIDALKDGGADHPGVPLATDPALIEQTPVGPLPQVSADGRTPRETYAAPYSDPDQLPRIAILIRGLGLSNNSTQRAIDELPPEITLAFVPYATGLQDWVEKARLNGHEAMLELPMEPYGYPNNDPGPYTLLTSADHRENLRRLHWLMSRFTGYVGVTNYLGEKFVADKSALDEIVRELDTRGLLFLEDSSSARSMLGPLANKHGLHWNKSNRAIDRASATTVDADLARLEAHARRHGISIGTGFAFPVTIETIALWAQSLREKDLRLAPISSTVDTTLKEGGE